MTLDIQNLAYAVTQAIHNFGAVAVVGGSAVALAWRESNDLTKLSRMVLAGWIVQVLSGATFGAISYYYYTKFPDLMGIAVVALLVKVSCAALGISLAAGQLKGHFSDAMFRYSWLAMCILGVLALTSAAVLRWFS